RRGSFDPRRAYFGSSRISPKADAKLLLAALLGRACGHGGDGLQDAAGNLVGVALRVRPAVFEVSLVVVVHEAVRNADRGAAVGDAVVELVDGLRLMQAGQAQMII